MFGKQKQTTKWTISPIPGKENTDYDPSLYQNVQTVSYRTNVNYNNQQHSDSDESDETMDNHMLIDPFFEYQFRVILIGDSGAGKSSLLRCFTDGSFFEVSDPTVGVDFFARVLKVADGTPIKLQLWDTAGHERFRSITKSYYRNSVGCLLVYDVCNRESFTHIPTWMNEAKRHIEPHKAVFIVVGCKRDMASENLAKNREVSEEEARAFAHFNNLPYVETSSKTGLNVEDAFAILTQAIYVKIESGEYKVDGEWDGIKRGFYLAAGTRINNNYPRSSRAGRNTVSLAEGTPVDRKCC